MHTLDLARVNILGFGKVKWGIRPEWFSCNRTSFHLSLCAFHCTKLFVDVLFYDLFNLPWFFNLSHAGELSKGHCHVVVLSF